MGALCSTFCNLLTTLVRIICLAKICNQQERITKNVDGSVSVEVAIGPAAYRTAKVSDKSERVAKDCLLYTSPSPRDRG